MKVVRIISKKAGFRRAGLAHPDSAVDHEPKKFTKAQLEQLKAEPMLIVQELDVADPKAADDDKITGKK